MILSALCKSIPFRMVLFIAAIPLLQFSTVYPQTHPLRFDHLTTKDGLSQDIVTSIVQDPRGFMWFGTEDGLNRYDGYTIRTYKYNPFDSSSITSNSINALLIDSQGRLWVSAGAISLYDERTDSFIRFHHSTADSSSPAYEHIQSLCQDSAGAIWAGSDAGLAKLDFKTRQWLRYRHAESDPASLSSDVVRSLFTDSKGVFWVGTERGLERFDATHGKFLHSPIRTTRAHADMGIAVTSFFENRDGTFWLGTDSDGLIRYDPKTSTVRRFVRSADARMTPGDNLIFAVHADHRGRLWLGHYNGLDIFDPSTGIFDHYVRSPNDPDAIAGTRVYAMYFERKGAVWLGTYHGGVERYDPDHQKFALFRPNQGQRNGIPNENVLSLLEDSNKNIWIGTQSGLSVMKQTYGIDGPGLLPTREIPKMATDAILSIFEDSHHTVWVGHDKPGTLDRINIQGQLIARYAFPGVRSICEDFQGALWFGTREDGLVRFLTRNGGITWYRNRPDNPDSLWGDGVWCLFADREGGIWAASSGVGEGLSRFDIAEQRFSHFEHKAGDASTIPAATARSIYEDYAGIFWIGFWGAGLARFEPSTSRFTVYTEGQGLSSNYVKGILADTHRNLWISTERGISRFDPANGTFRNYTAEDGLQGDRFYSGSAVKARNGYMYFGGEHGLNVFHPDSVRIETTPPDVRLTNFKVFDRTVSFPDVIENISEVELSYLQNFLSFEFVAFDYSSPKRIRYAYMLEGFNQEWVDAGDRRYASYTHLDGGTYVFRVKAANSDGIWNEKGASMKLVIHPPFWDTFWFRVLALFAIGGVLYVAYRVRIGRLLAVERFRQRIAQDLHDDIGTNLSTIALASKSLTRKQRLGKEASEVLNRISSVAERTTDQMKDIVWVLKTDNDSLNSIAEKMQDVARHLLVGIQYKFEAPAEGLLEKVGLEFKRNVFLFYKECLNNIAKHSHASDVTIKLEQRGSEFVLEINDNGTGFEKREPSFGSGLQNLRARAAQLGGSVTITGNPGEGTHILLAVRMTQMRHSFRTKDRLP